MTKRRSFFEKLTGSIRLDEDEDVLDEDTDLEIYDDEDVDERRIYPLSIDDEESQEEMEGELALDVIETPDAIIIKTMTAGVKKDDIEISLTRDSIIIRGKRQSETSLDEHDWHYKELYWGSFSRTLALPAEVDIDQAKATEQHGLLTLTLPKIDRNRGTKVKIH